MKYVYIKTPTPVIRAHKLLDNQPTTSLALFNIHESIEPMIPGSDANALSANLPNNCDRAFNLFFIHSLAPPFLSLVVVLCDVGADALGPPNRASIRRPYSHTNSSQYGHNCYTLFLKEGSYSLTKCARFFVQEFCDRSPDLINLFRGFTF